MKIKITALVLASALFSQCILAENACNVIGFHEPGTNVYDGPTFCERITLPDITVYGPLQITQSIIQGNALISGPVKASSSRFSTVTIESNLSHDTVSLQNNSIVQHDLCFNGLKGTLILDHSSKVLGKVINADIQQQ